MLNQRAKSSSRKPPKSLVTTTRLILHGELWFQGNYSQRVMSPKARAEWISHAMTRSLGCSQSPRSWWEEADVCVSEHTGSLTQRRAGLPHKLGHWPLAWLLCLPTSWQGWPPSNFAEIYSWEVLQKHQWLQWVHHFNLSTWNRQVLESLWEFS